MSTKTVSSRRWPATAGKLRQGVRGKCAQSGSLSNDLHAVEKWIGRLRKRHGKGTLLRACYEAGPCGFGLARRLRQLTPTRSGNRVKTDKRKLCKL